MVPINFHFLLRCNLGDGWKNWRGGCFHISISPPKNWGRLPFSLKLRLSSILPKTWGRLPFSIKYKIDFIFYLPKNLGLLPFPLEIKVVFHFTLKIEVVFHFPKNGGCLPFTERLRSSSICPKIEVVIQFGSCCKVTWSTLTGKCLKINFPGWGAGVGRLLD